VAASRTACLDRNLSPQILSEFNGGKKCENSSTFGEDIVKIKVTYFFGDIGSEFPQRIAVVTQVVEWS